MLVDPPTVLEKDGDVGIKILGIEFWHSQVRQEMEEWVLLSHYNGQNRDYPV